MVLDHALIVFGEGWLSQGVRMTLTRAALPLFCVVAGSLATVFVGRMRFGTLAAWSVVAAVMGVLLGIAQPDILLLLALGLSVMPLRGEVTWWPVFALAILQPVTWPLPWAGYQFGTVLALLMVGRLIERGELDALGRWLPAWIGWIGRHPLWWYLGHLAVLCALASVVQGWGAI
jgi:hypothetical protein